MKVVYLTKHIVAGDGIEYLDDDQFHELTEKDDPKIILEEFINDDLCIEVAGEDNPTFKIQKNGKLFIGTSDDCDGGGTPAIYRIKVLEIDVDDIRRKLTSHLKVAAYCDLIRFAKIAELVEIDDE
jgi:hypothetical protein